MNFDGFHPFTLKNGWQNAVLLWCMLQAGTPSLNYYCAVVLHSCIVLPSVGHSSNHEHHCSQLADNRAVFRLIIVLLRFSFDSHSFKYTFYPKHTHNYQNTHIYKHTSVLQNKWKERQYKHKYMSLNTQICTVTSKHFEVILAWFICRIHFCK